MPQTTDRMGTDQGPHLVESEPIMSPERGLLILLERDGARCMDCGIGLAHKSLPGTTTPDPTRQNGYRVAEGLSHATVDHVIPRAAGGLNRLSNYELVCQPCNTARWHAWRLAHPEWTPTPNARSEAREAAKRRQREINNQYGAAAIIAGMSGSTLDEALRRLTR